MKIKKLYLYALDKTMTLFGIDSMKYRLKRYRFNGAKIGDNVRAFSPITSAEPYLITIGNNVTIATNVRFITHDNSAIKIYEDATDFVGPINIGNNVFIGAGSIILPGVNIPDNCIVGAGSLVCKSVNVQGSIIGGNPAKVIGDIDSMKNRYSDKKFNFMGKNRKNEILENPQKWIIK